MEPLQKLFANATLQEVLSPLKLRTARLRTSFYADDAALFVNPVRADVTAVHRILELFGDASGLRTSFNKCVAYPVACQGVDVDDVLHDFGGAKGSLPCHYLGLPLGFRKPRKIDVQPLFDKVVGRLKGGRGKMMTRKGRLTLINSVATATATYFLTIFPAEKWMIKKFDKLRRDFLWAPEEEAKGSKCLVSWKKICAPVEYGGLGVKDLQAFSRALRLRWEWFNWDEHDRPWKGTATPCDLVDKNLFQACTELTLGDGKTAKFWYDCWLQGRAPGCIAPLLVPLATRKNLTVSEALRNGRWMRGLQRISTLEQFEQLVTLWGEVQQVQLSTDRDTMRWKLTANGCYSASSAYGFQFIGRVKQPDLQMAWNIHAEGKVKFFFWLLLQNRNWTADRLRARGWPHDDLCCLCNLQLETADHLALQCEFAIEVMDCFLTSRPSMVQQMRQATTVRQWWSKNRGGGKGVQHNEDVTVAVYIFWHVWKERGRRIFQHENLGANAIASLIRSDIDLLTLARFRT